MHVCVHVHPLHSTAALARVEDGAIHKLSSHVRDVRIGADISGVISAEFEVYRDDSASDCFADAETARCGAGERDELDLGELDDLVEHIGRADVDELEDVGRETGLGEVGEEAFAEDGGLRGRAEEDSVSGEEGGDEGVDGDEVGKLSR